MASPIAHAVTGYALSELFPLKSHPQYPEKRYNWYSFLAVFIAIFADFDFIPQLLTGERFHRGLTHSLIFAVGFSLIVSLWGNHLGKISALKLIRWTFTIRYSHRRWIWCANLLSLFRDSCSITISSFSSCSPFERTL